MDHNEDIDKEICISLSIFWDIAVQGGNEVMCYLSLYLSMGRPLIFPREGPIGPDLFEISMCTS